MGEEPDDCKSMMIKRIPTSMTPILLNVQSYLTTEDKSKERLGSVSSYRNRLSWLVALAALVAVSSCSSDGEPSDKEIEEIVDRAFENFLKDALEDFGG